VIIAPNNSPPLATIRLFNVKGNTTLCALIGRKNLTKREGSYCGGRGNLQSYEDRLREFRRKERNALAFGSLFVAFSVGPAAEGK
jgi:hypothetical protein